MKPNNKAAPQIDAERLQRREAVDYARASLRLSGLSLSPEAEALNARYVAGEIDIDELIAATHRQLGFDPVKVAAEGRCNPDALTDEEWSRFGLADLQSPEGTGERAGAVGYDKDGHLVRIGKDGRPERI